MQAALKESSETRSAVRQELMAEYNNFVQAKRQEAEKQIKEAAQAIAVEKLRLGKKFMFKQKLLPMT